MKKRVFMGECVGLQYIVLYLYFAGACEGWVRGTESCIFCTESFVYGG